MTKQEFLERAREKHGYKYNYHNLPDKILSNQNIEIEYMGEIYIQKVVKHILLGRCPEKNTPRKTTDQFIEEAKKIWGDKYDYSLTIYEGSLKPIKVIYEGCVFEQTAISHLRYAAEIRSNNEFFIKRAKDKWGDKYDYSLVEYIDARTKVKIIHKQSGKIYEQTPDSHLRGSPDKLIKRKTTEEFIEQSNIVHNYKYNYDKVEYVNSRVKVVVTCPVHGDFSQTPNSHLQGNGCPYCSESRGEKGIVKFLDTYNIYYERQKKFSECKNIFELPFDFYIPSKRICIEFDGKQHYEPMDFFGGIKAYESLKLNDKIKNDFCEDNTIDLIRIKYDQIDSIEEILKEKLLIV